MYSCETRSSRFRCEKTVICLNIRVAGAVWSLCICYYRHHSSNFAKLASYQLTYLYEDDPDEAKRKLFVMAASYFPLFPASGAFWPLLSFLFNFPSPETLWKWSETQPRVSCLTEFNSVSNNLLKSIAISPLARMSRLSCVCIVKRLDDFWLQWRK